MIVEDAQKEALKEMQLRTPNHLNGVKKRVPTSIEGFIQIIVCRWYSETVNREGLIDDSIYAPAWTFTH